MSEANSTKRMSMGMALQLDFNEKKCLFEDLTQEDIEAEAEELLNTLRSEKEAWFRLPMAEKCDLLATVRKRFAEIAASKTWAQDIAQTVMMTDVEGYLQLFMLSNVLVISSYFERLETNLRALDAGTLPSLSTTSGPGGRTVVRTFPTSADRARTEALCGLTCDLWLRPGAQPTRGAEIKNATPGVSVVYGAGNQAFLGLMDVLDIMFVRGHTVLLKWNPTQELCIPYMDYVLAPLSERGYLRCAISGVTFAKTLVNHPDVDHYHITGGIATYRKLLYARTPESGEVPPSGETMMPIKQRFTSELGCVTPWIVSPGKWTKGALDVQVKGMVTAVLSYGSANCLSPKVLIVQKEWPQREEFERLFEKAVTECPLIAAWYPGSAQRWRRFRSKYPQAKELRMKGSYVGDEHLPLLVVEIDAEGKDLRGEFALVEEAFSPVIALVRVPAASTPAFLEKAVSIANDECYGSLSCSITVPPSVDKEYPDAVNRAVEDLRYGSVCVNVWSVAGFLIETGTWGGWDATVVSKTADQDRSFSGHGFAHNLCFLDHPEKTVTRTSIQSPFIQAFYLPHMLPVALPMKLVQFVARFLTGTAFEWCARRSQTPQPVTEPTRRLYSPRSTAERNSPTGKRFSVSPVIGRQGSKEANPFGRETS